MLEFTSTETLMLITFLCRNMPNFLGYIMLYSGKQGMGAQIMHLTADKIHEAREHPNALVAQGMRTLASLQSALNITIDKLEAIAHERSIIESNISAFLSMENKG